ncbi:MAG: ribosome maturation factor RimM [Alphaproteobacteria bacterium]
MSQAKHMVCLGRIAGAHGVRGAVRVESFTARAGDVTAYGPLSDETGRRTFALAIVGEARGMLLARIDGIADRDAAEALAGTRLHVARTALPEPAAEEFYHSDLIGLACERPDGSPYGVVKALYDFGAGDVLEVERPGGVRVMLPFSSTVVPLIDVAAGRLVVEPPLELEGAELAEADRPDEAEGLDEAAAAATAMDGRRA